jgi:ribulose 1,5-bisphosphate carboxylase large subunit-like protein
MSTLKDHEKLCEQRFSEVNRRLASVESKIDEIHHTIDGFQKYLLQLAIKSAMGIFALVCAAVFVIKL